MTLLRVLLVAFMATLSSCAIQEVEMVKFNDYNLTHVEGGFRIKLNVTINNPNAFNIKVKKTKLMLDVNGSDAGEIKLNEPVKIQKRSETDYDFILIADSKQITRAIANAGIGIALSGKVNLTVKGWIKGKVFGVGKKIDILHKESFSTKDLGL